MDGPSVEIFALGVYLMNGGTVDGYLDMNFDEIQIMLATYMATERKRTLDIIEGIGTMFGAEKK